MARKYELTENHRAVLDRLLGLGLPCPAIQRLARTMGLPSVAFHRWQDERWQMALGISSLDKICPDDSDEVSS